MEHTKKPKLLEATREVMRRRHYSLVTERSYINWIRRYIYFHNKQHPANLGPAPISQLLTHLAVNGRVAPATPETSVAFRRFNR